MDYVIQCIVWNNLISGIIGILQTGHKNERGEFGGIRINLSENIESVYFSQELIHIWIKQRSE